LAQHFAAAFGLARGKDESMPLGYIPGAHSGWWNTLSHRVFGSRKFSRTIEYRIIRSWLPTGKVRILDVAAGVGELSQQLALAGHSVTAFDCDARALSEANVSGVPPIQLVHGDAHALPFPNQAFDLVVCNSALEHFTEDERALAEMARVLCHDGRIILTTDTFPCGISPLLKLLPKTWWRDELRQDPCRLRDAMQAHHREMHGVVNYYTLDDLENKMQRQGLEVKHACHYLNGLVSKSIFEAHILIKRLDFYNALSRRLFPLFFPFTFPTRKKTEGYGLAVCAIKSLRR
jgi:SAM-dependent methyltransferase